MSRVILFSGCAAAAGLAFSTPVWAASPGDTASADLIETYCVECHNFSDWAGGLALDPQGVAHASGEPEVWEPVVRKVRTGMMPPAGEPRPDRAAMDAFAADVEARLDLAAAERPDPGAEPIHRLNRTEYANAIRDLLAYQIDVDTLLPADDAAEGFDNMAEVLVVSPTLIQAYLSTAMKISRRAIGDRTALPSRSVYQAPDGLDQSGYVEGLPLGTRGGFVIDHNFPLDAQYEFSIAASGKSGPGLPGSRYAEPPDIHVTIDGAPIPNEGGAEFRIPVPAGPHRITVALADTRRSLGVDDIYWMHGDSGAVREVVINGPFDATGPGDTPSRRAIFVCYPDSAAEEEPCALEIMATLATRAFRRPVEEDNPALAPLLASYREGRAAGDFELGVQQALARLLVDPRFLYRLEAEPEGVRPGDIYDVSDLDLASRLSFFLWSSIPDQTLIDAAASGALRAPGGLEAQVARMLADPRAEALAQNFAGQWLHLRELEAAQPEDAEFDAALREAFGDETMRLFHAVLTEDRSVLDLLDADFTFLNERLASHYGIDGVRGGHMRRVSLPADSPRGGILGHGSVLTVTSVANRTSPVVRGAWVLENLFGAPAPQPPPGVEANIDAPAEGAATTLRERLEQHRADSSCASCHQIMDPIGLSLEHFDKVGRWRDRDGGHPIDASGVLVDGTPLNGPTDLRAALLDREIAYVTAVTEKLLTYALGRGVEASDMPAVRRIVAEAAPGDYRLSDLVLGVVRSDPFQKKIKIAQDTESEG